MGEWEGEIALCLVFLGHTFMSSEKWVHPFELDNIWHNRSTSVTYRELEIPRENNPRT